MSLFFACIPWMYLPVLVQVLITVVMLLMFFHNGGRFYVDHFWKSYERNALLYVDAAYSAMSQANAVRTSKEKSLAKHGDDKDDDEVDGRKSSLDRSPSGLSFENTDNTDGAETEIEDRSA